MTFYNWNTKGPPLLPPANVIDAEGNYCRGVLWCDTETGEMERMGDHGWELHVKETRPAPLKVVFEDDPEYKLPPEYRNPHA